MCSSASARTWRHTTHLQTHHTPHTYTHTHTHTHTQHSQTQTNTVTQNVCHTHTRTHTQSVSQSHRHICRRLVLDDGPEGDAPGRDDKDTHHGPRLRMAHRLILVDTEWPKSPLPCPACRAALKAHLSRLPLCVASIPKRKHDRNFRRHDFESYGMGLWAHRTTAPQANTHTQHCVNTHPQHPSARPTSNQPRRKLASRQTDGGGGGPISRE